jgi:hypothetical protein
MFLGARRVALLAASRIAIKAEVRRPPCLLVLDVDSSALSFVQYMFTRYPFVFASRVTCGSRSAHRQPGVCELLSTGMLGC